MWIFLKEISRAKLRLGWLKSQNPQFTYSKYDMYCCYYTSLTFFSLLLSQFISTLPEKNPPLFLIREMTQLARGDIHVESRGTWVCV